MTTEQDERELAPALLTRNEILYLRGQLTDISPGYERKLKHDINRKLQTLRLLELPLLAERGFARVEGVTAGNNNVTISSNALVAKTGRALPWEGSIVSTGDNENRALGGNIGVFDAFDPATSTLPR